MSTKIAPQEMLLLSDNPVIRTICAPQFITDDMVKLHVRRANLAVGDILLVQCLTHDRQRLVAEAEYRVTARVTSLKVVEKPDFSTHQSTDVAYEVERWSDWHYVNDPQHIDVPEPTPGDVEVLAHPTVKWNVGKRVYEVIASGAVIGEYENKDEALQAASAYGSTAAA